MSLPKLISVESMMPSNQLLFCHPLLLMPLIFPSIRVFSNESALHIRWSKQIPFQLHLSPEPLVKMNLLYSGTSQVVLVVKNLPANAGDIRDTGLVPGSGRSPEGENGNPLQYSCLENCFIEGETFPAVTLVHIHSFGFFPQDKQWPIKWALFASSYLSLLRILFLKQEILLIFYDFIFSWIPSYFLDFLSSFLRGLMFFLCIA